MSPVSFQTVGGSPDRAVLLAQARALTSAGIRVFDMNSERGLLIRSDQFARAELVLAEHEKDTRDLDER